MPWGECTVTLEDVAYQLGLPIDGEPVTGCLYEFETWMPDGRGRPRWDWFKDVFGVIPHRAQRMHLFGIRLLLEFLLDGYPSWTRLMTLGNTVGVLPLWRGCTGTFAVIQTGTWSTLQARNSSYRAGYFGGFLGSDLVISISSAGPWARFLPTSDEKDPRVLKYRAHLDQMTHRDVAFVADASIWRPEHMSLWTSMCTLIYFGCIEWHQVDRVIPQFGGVQNAPHRPVNIDWLHARDGREGDRWFPSAYQSWHGLWYSRHDHTFTVEEVQDPGPSADYFRWWFLAGKRYLAPANPLFPRPPDEIPPEAFDRVANTPDTYRFDDAPDNRRAERRRMVGMRTTARDWQWVDEMLGDDVPAPRRARRMPEGGSRRGGI
ncbi:hypothetical protein PIB30_037822 [Stylosanthes scabra]|uniref:Aminotransferase-like plant mobile domain-containing protein n=1 Tax=Stylosanthes scabra TaxID=79078 RepID=A0ABU6RDX6_9FABA|nr:hypothetical protein [Stylosanthes scabra]